MTTLASGRCTSLPGDVDTAIGTKPRLAATALGHSARHIDPTFRALVSHRGVGVRARRAVAVDEHAAAVTDLNSGGDDADRTGRRYEARGASNGTAC